MNPPHKHVTDMPSSGFGINADDAKLQLHCSYIALHSKLITPNCASCSADDAKHANCQLHPLGLPDPGLPRYLRHLEVTVALKGMQEAEG